MVELHGGGISADSEGLGKGSEFTLWLPRAEPAAELPFAPRDGHVAPGPPLRVLVVDDNVDTARGISLLMKSLGHEVQVCYNGNAGAAAALEMRPDLALLDLGLPGMDGFQLAAAIRSEESLRSTRLIAISGYGQAEDRRRSLEVGFDDHLVKPVDIQTLKSILAATPRLAGKDA